MMNAAGIRTGWRIIQGTPAFLHQYQETLHNALQGRTAADFSDVGKSHIRAGCRRKTHCGFIWEDCDARHRP